MRLNRGTILLGLVSIIVIAAVVLLSNQPGGLTVDTGTPTATAESAGPLFPDINSVDTQSKIVRFEIDNTADSTKVVMTKDAASVWTVSEATNAQQLATDQTKAVGMMSNLASLTAIEKFTTDKVADYGLDKPAYIMTLTDSAGKTYVVKVGKKATTTPRYYVLINDDAKTVYLVQNSTVDMLIANIAIPAYVASPTPLPSLTPSPNPYSEVEQTATAVVEQQQFIVTLTAMAETTSEATGEVTPETTAQIAPAATTVPATATPQPPTATTAPASATPTATPTVTASPTTGS
ncbi:MAG: DUF4340 domain-containing protein [Anaerolineae bacterium]|nr:DUF4340 domain-containing protein [Anaerolineae bacterium]